MENYSSRLRRVLALFMACAMVVTSLFVSPMEANAASAKKYVKSLSLSKSKVTVNLDSTGKSKNTTVKASVKVVKAANKQVTVKSSKKDVATVKVGKPNAKGVSKITITAKKAGKSTITVTTKGKNNKNKKISKKITVTVNKPSEVAVTAVNIAAVNNTLSVGGETKVTASVIPANATDSAITYSSSNPAVATVDSKTGVVKAVAPGSVSISATASNGVSKSVSITVKSSTVPVTDVTITTQKTAISVGEPVVVSASVVPENATDKTITFSSSNSAIATVDPKTGAVLGISKGNVSITATAANGVKKSVNIEVETVAVTGIELDRSEAEIAIPGNLALTATVYPDNATNKNVKWQSKDPGIASVDVNSGRVTAVSEGETIITATTEDGEINATCKVKVQNQQVVADNLSVVVTNAITINERPQEKNVQLVSRDMTFLATVVKDGKPVQAGDNITVSMAYLYGNMYDYFEVRENTITTNDKGQATFTVGLKNAYSELTAKDHKFQTIRLTARESASNQSNTITVKFASVELNDIEILKGSPFSLLETGENAVENDSGLFTTKSQNGTMEQTYVNNQQVSSQDKDHKVYMTAAPYLVLPEGSETIVRTDWTKDVSNETRRCSVYNDQSNEQTTVVVTEIPAGLEYLTLDFDVFELSRYTRMQLDVYDAKGRSIYYQEQRTSENNGTRHIQLRHLSQDTESYLMVSLISEGQVDTASRGYALIKATGVFASENREQSELVELEGTVTWSDVSKDLIEQTEIMSWSYEEAAKYIPSDSQYLNKDYVYKYQIPVFPYSGNAILIVSNKNNEELAYFSFPAENEYSEQEKKYLNRNTLAASTINKKAILISEAEKKNTTGSLTQQGNMAILDASATGMQFVKATINVSYLTEEELNKQNGGEMYSFVHWAPIPNEDLIIDDPDYFAVEGQYIDVTAQLVDKNGNAQTNEGEQIKFKYDDPDPESDTKKEVDVSGADSKVGLNATFVSVTNNGATDAKGKVTIRFRDITNNEEFSSIEGLVAESSKFNVVLSVGSEKESVSSAVDLYWVDMGMTFVDSAYKSDQPVRTTNFIDKEIAIQKSANYSVSDTNKWEVAYLPVARSRKFQYKYPEQVDRSNIEKIHEFAAVDGVGISYNKSGKMDVSTKDSVATINSVITGNAELAGSLLIDDFSKVKFHYYNDKGELVTANNIGKGDNASTKNTIMTLKTIWEPDGIKAVSIYPRYVCENSEADVYIMVTDKYDNPLAGKQVTYTITGVNALSGKQEAVETENAGVYKIHLSNPKSIEAVDSTIVVYVTDKEYSDAAVIVSYIQDPESEFDIQQDGEDKVSYKVSKDGKTIEVYFTNEVSMDSVYKDMFKLVKPSDGSEISVDSIKPGDRNSIILTMNKEPDTSLEYRLVISKHDDKGVITLLADKYGQFIENKETTFKLSDYIPK